MNRWPSLNVRQAHHRKRHIVDEDRLTWIAKAQRRRQELRSDPGVDARLSCTAPARPGPV